MKGVRSKVSSPTLDELLHDCRLRRLFSAEARDCALQLWILQIRSGTSLESRVVYGRLLPYNHSSDRWSATDDDRFRTLREGISTQFVRLNLYVKSDRCEALLRSLCSGRTISELSAELGLGSPGALNARFGATALAAHTLVYRPVACLLNRDAGERLSLASPHGGAGAFSASITRTDKEELFRVGESYDGALAASAIEQLSADTGLNFGGSDVSRFGDLELMVFPALDDLERSLLSVSWIGDPTTLVARFNPIQLPQFGRFEVRLNITNDGQIIYSGLATAEPDAQGIFETRFGLTEQLHSRADGSEIEIFAFNNEEPGVGTLCCRWRTGYIREIHTQGILANQKTTPIKFDWLEKTVRPTTAARAKSVLTINRGGPGFASQVGGREADPWVPANRNLVSLFRRLHPPKSEGRFFLRWGQGDGEGRLLFAEWFKALLHKYQQHQITIFDPYFETAGLGLLLVGAARDADYIVFRSLPKHKPKRDEDGAGEPASDYLVLDETSDEETDEAGSAGIDNLVASCEHNRSSLRHFRLRIFGLKYGRLHDRYILVMGADGLPVAGFHLSNSFQSAAQNFPLLITPIPADTLLEVERYKSELVYEAGRPQPDRGSEAPAMRLLFESTSSSSREVRHYEPLRFLEKAQAGDALSLWIGAPSLRGLCGEPLKERMKELALLKDESLKLPGIDGLRRALGRGLGDDIAGFMANWEVLGEVLAHSPVENYHLEELRPDQGFLSCLREVLAAAFDRQHDGEEKEFTIIDSQSFRDTVETLLQQSRRPHHFFHPTKYAGLNWSEYFAIKLLWWHAPDQLLKMTEAHAARVPAEHGDSDVVRLSLLSQIVSDISLSVQLDIDRTHRDDLINSHMGLLKWLGLNALERQLDRPDGLADVLTRITSFSYVDQVRTLGWMVHNAAKDPRKAETYGRLVSALHGTLPATVAAHDLNHLVDSMRGHMRRLSWAEPWLFRDVIAPLLDNGRASFDDACEIWIEELKMVLGLLPEHNSRLFNRAREGQTTNIAAFLLAGSGPARRRTSVKALKAILKQSQRIVQQPLASTSDWTRWDGALGVSMWILGFARWGQYYLREQSAEDSGLDRLAADALALAMVRPMSEWRSMNVGAGEFAAFLDHADELLGS